MKSDQVIRLRRRLIAQLRERVVHTELDIRSPGDELSAAAEEVERLLIRLLVPQPGIDPSPKRVFA